MRTAEDAHAELIDYALGLKELNPALYEAAALDYQRTRHGALVATIQGQRVGLMPAIANDKTAEELDAMSPDAVRALLNAQLGHLATAEAKETSVAAMYDACLERIKAIWREYEFGERQDGPEMATETPQLAPDAQTQQREPGEEG